MQWICNLALFMVLSGILLEVIADTKYHKFARWVTGVILLLQFIKPLAETGDMKNRFMASIGAFDYAIGTEKILEEIYQVSGQTENTVLKNYKAAITDQIGKILENNGLALETAELSVAEDGTLEELFVWARYQDGRRNTAILIPTVVPVNIRETKEKETVSPMELYIRGILAEFYQIEENKIEVVIREAE